MSDRIYLFDTTLRDGAQTTGVDFSVADKIAIAKSLDKLGIDYVEGGWPGANLTDDEFFEKPPVFKISKLVAFGMTRRPGRSADNDPGLASLINSKADAICLVGKSWDFHVKVALNISQDENIAMIEDSIKLSKAKKGEAIYDAEHFFDGYKENPKFAISCLTAAIAGGARWMVLCDTNGGTLPHDVGRIISEVAKTIPAHMLGIHAHNDTENAVANSIAAVNAGARMVQGTINGLGERCGNANLMSLIPSLMLKMGFETGIKPENLPQLTNISRLLDDRLNRDSNRHAAYVGASAFAHKGGLHVSAVSKDPRTYEHIDPIAIGNRRHIIVSDQAGKSNVIARLDEAGIKINDDKKLMRLLDLLKEKEFNGYSYDGAEASFELLAHGILGQLPEYFNMQRFRVMDDRRRNDNGDLVTESEATVTIGVAGKKIMRVSMGNGPVNALDMAMREALIECYPQLVDMQLVDYKVRIMQPDGDSSGTDAVTRVIIESSDTSGIRWATVGVSANIIDASYIALRDAYHFKLFKSEKT